MNKKIQTVIIDNISRNVSSSNFDRAADYITKYTSTIRGQFNLRRIDWLVCTISKLTNLIYSDSIVKNTDYQCFKHIAHIISTCDIETGKRLVFAQFHRNLKGIIEYQIKLLIKDRVTEHKDIIGKNTIKELKIIKLSLNKLGICSELSIKIGDLLLLNELKK